MARFDKYFFLGPPEVVDPPLPTNLLLDIYPNALTAYSTVRISSSYTGNILRVRRSSDNQELDIPYNGSDVLDESVLSAFIGASDAYVTKWYDQSGNSFDQAQASVLNQPKIATAGTILKEGSRVTVAFDGTDDFTLTTRTINVNGLTEFTQSIVTTPVQATAPSINIQRSQQAITPSGNWGLLGQSLYKTAAQWRFGTGQVSNYNSLGISINKQCIYSVFKTNTLEEPRLDNTDLASTNRLATLANNSLVTELGRSQSAYFQGNLSQAIMWMSSYSSVKADLHDTINAIYASY
jgi:hypothetical protein